MENVSKALLIAAGMFLAILLISLLVSFYGDISHHYAQEHERKMIEQSYEFNKRFEAYNRNDIRGTDLISLMNRVIDYNATESYFEGTGFERIKVTIEIGDDEIRKQFIRYETNDNIILNKYLTKTITNVVSGSTDNWGNDRKLVEITNTPVELCEKAKNSKYEINMTERKLKKLEEIIEYIMVDENSDYNTDVYYRFQRQEEIKRILGINIAVYDETGKTKPSDEDLVALIKELTSQYHQYTQFKRAYFDCKEVKYNPNTNRVVEMKFKLQTIEEDGKPKVVFN